MEAKEMFEELGYKHYIDAGNAKTNCYEKELILNFQDGHDNDFYNCLYINNANKEDISFSKEELKAIQKQIEELGW